MHFLNSIANNLILELSKKYDSGVYRKKHMRTDTFIKLDKRRFCHVTILKKRIRKC